MYKMFLYIFKLLSGRCAYGSKRVVIICFLHKHDTKCNVIKKHITNNGDTDKACFAANYPNGE